MKHIVTKPLEFLWHHKVLSVILIVIALGIGGYVLLNKGKKELFDEKKVTLGTVVEAIESSGKVKVKKSAQLMFATPAKVTWVGIKKGDQVKKGQIIATLDRRELEKNIKKKLADYKTARWNLEQSYDDNSVAGLPLNKVGLLSDAEKRIIEKNQFTMDSSVFDVEIATLALEQSSLVSPIEGTVTDDGRFVAGEQLTSQDTTTRFVKIIDLSSIYFQADVDESEYAKVKVGMPVTLTLDAFPGTTLKGEVTYIGKEGVKKTGGGIQVPADITLEKTDLALVPELSGDVSMISQEKQNVLVIDKKYARKKDGAYVVDVVGKDGKKKEQSIDVGLVGTQTLEIRGGIAEGDTIVIPKQNTNVPQAQNRRSE